jgi:pimeloyl-ACP methyl ester carboxylesterase
MPPYFTNCLFDRLIHETAEMTGTMRMRQSLMAILLIAAFGLGGCAAGKIFASGEQPYVTNQRMERGLVLVLTGIEGRSSFNEGIAEGLAKGGVPYAVEIDDWTFSCSVLLNLESQTHNRRTAAEIAQRIIRYKWAYPDRPVFLVGQSGGGAMAAWIAEAMESENLDGIILLAATLSPDYRLDLALSKSIRGIVNFYSPRDVLMLGLGTNMFRTMDGEFTSSAGRVSFTVPRLRPPIYDKLYQVCWNSKMASGTGNAGSHLSSGDQEFVARYVAPLVQAGAWNQSLITRLTAGKPSPATRPKGEGEEDDSRQRVR